MTHKKGKGATGCHNTGPKRTPVERKLDEEEMISLRIYMQHDSIKGISPPDRGLGEVFWRDDEEDTDAAVPMRTRAIPISIISSSSVLAPAIRSA